MRLKKQEIKSFLSLEDFVSNWNSKHEEKMEVMGENTAVARGDKNLWIAEKRNFCYFFISLCFKRYTGFF